MPNYRGLGVAALLVRLFGKHVHQRLARASQRHPDPVEQTLTDPQTHILGQIGITQGGAARGQFLRDEWGG